MSGGQHRRHRYDRESVRTDAGTGTYAEELAATREVLATTEVVGHPHREAELYELERLVSKYPAETLQIIDRLRRPSPAPPPP